MPRRPPRWCAPAAALSVAACGPSADDPPPAPPQDVPAAASPADPAPPARPRGPGGVRGKAPPGGPPPPPEPFHATPTFELVGDASDAPKSVLLISLDTVRADRLGAYGGRAETPQLSALAAAGARFDQAITHFPETCLSHWAMHSGVSPEAHGDAPAVSGSVYTGPTLAELAGRHGYATGGFIGGVTLTAGACGLDRGFSHYDDQFPLDRADMRRPGRQVTQRAVSWIEGQSGPWFAFVHYFDAHFPYTPAAPWDTRYDPDYAGTLTGSDADLRPYRDGGEAPSAADLAHVLALYDGELSELDALLGPLLAAAGPDTVVLVTADHGESFSHDYWFNHRDALWDGVLHVPLLLRGPGVPAGVSVPDQVGLIDVAPTLLSLAGLPADARMEGRDLRPLLAGAGLDPRPVFSTTDPQRAPVQRAVRTLEDKWIDHPSGLLHYDLGADPAEQSPLPGAEARDLEERWAPHAAALSARQRHAVPAPPSRAIPPEEAARLEALGYRQGPGPAGGAPPPPPPGDR